jgi:pre-mRNA-splicing factor SYF2
MSPNKRRKLSPAAEEASDSKDTLTASVSDHQHDSTENNKPTERADLPPSAETPESNPASTPSTSTPPTTAPTSSDRLARFAALKARATDSARSNLAAAKDEAKRSALDPTLLANLSRRSAIAQHNLLKADVEAEGGSGTFERKRAWDYTIEESEKWDERMAAKKAARENNAFQDYSAEAGKIYERQIREMEKLAGKDGGKLREEYDTAKTELLEHAARGGGLEIVEMENGEMVAIDKEGRFYADHDSTGFVEQKPKKENVDRLVEDLRKADEVRMKKRRARGMEADEGDVTFINEKNKQFNMKLARFYDRYTTDIRESFERGTAL